MKLFKRQEILGVAVILFAITLITYINILISLRNERDLIRNLDVSAIAKGVVMYNSDYGFYPTSKDGKILACADENTSVLKDENKQPVYFSKSAKKPMLKNLIVCEWGQDALLDVTDTSYPSYITTIPKDPRQENGYSYLYLSDGDNFQILGSFEGKSQDEYDSKIKALKISCGAKICNFGKTSMEIIKEPLQ
ncbi:hypothetical protein ACFL0F_01070 [Patescibacteria group bacterium]